MEIAKRALCTDSINNETPVFTIFVGSHMRYDFSITNNFFLYFQLENKVLALHQLTENEGNKSVTHEEKNFSLLSTKKYEKKKRVRKRWLRCYCCCNANVAL